MLKLFFSSVFLFISVFTYAKFTNANLTAQRQTHLPTDSTEYFGAKNQEAKFTFETQIFIPLSKGTPTDQMIQSEFKIYSKYMLGQMRRTTNNASAVYPTFSVHINKFEKASDTFNRVYVQFSGKGVFSPSQTNYTFLIPTYAPQIFQKSNSLCTEADSDKIDDGNFWYHWDPKKSGCPLIEGTDYSVVTAPLSYLANTNLTYPEYDRLIRNGQLRMTLFFGLSDYDDTNWNPNTNTSDWGAIGFKQEREALMKFGFQSQIWSETDIRKWYNPTPGQPLPYIETLSKNTPHGLLTLRLFLGNTGFDHDSKAFHLFLKDALWNDSSIIYNGHSGIGKNLDIPQIANLRGYKLPISNDYQILFLGSCVPYAYYTALFFHKKSSSLDLTGTKGLDIITYGNESTFANVDDIRLTTALIKYMDTGYRTSYQDIIQNEANFFLGVNGDEDNPQH